MRTCFCLEANRYQIFFKILCTFWILVFFIFSPAAAAVTSSKNLDTEFPIYPAIRPNVNFWIDVFSKYSDNQGVLHDNIRLDIVYDVLALDPARTLTAEKKNQKIKKTHVEKYRQILLALSKGKRPFTPEEKRIAALFGSRSTPEDFLSAASNIRCQTGLKQQFKEGLARSGAVIDEFRRIFRSHGLPLDLVYLPCVESSFDFKAYSKFGAAGVWQFTHSTGRLFMEIDYVVDERRDPYISSDAAARLLKKNYAELGEWPLAITAYNHGLAGMMRAKKAKGSYEKIFNSFSSSSFKFASRNFYSEFLAARTIAINPEKYIGKISYHKPVRFHTITTNGYLPVKELSDRLNISADEIHQLNPSLRPPVLNGQKYIPKGFHLKLPETIARKELTAHLTQIYKTDQKPSRFHRVQKGDTAGSIARLHSVRLNDLISANGLDRKAIIFIGQNLRIPAKDEMTVAQKPVLKKNPEKKMVILAELPEKLPEPSQPLPTEPQAKIPLTKPAIPPVAEIEKPSGVSEVETPEASPLEAKASPIEDITMIDPQIMTTNFNISKVLQEKSLTIGIITVEAEETLGHYADWLKVPTKAIRSLNRLKYGTSISIHQTIKLPLKHITAQKFEELRYDFHKEMEEDFFESFSIQGVDTYEVKEGDNIWRICADTLEIPFWLLEKYNPNLKFTGLALKQKITYPIIGKK